MQARLTPPRALLHCPLDAKQSWMTSRRLRKSYCAGIHQLVRSSNPASKRTVRRMLPAQLKGIASTVADRRRSCTVKQLPAAHPPAHTQLDEQQAEFHISNCTCMPISCHAHWSLPSRQAACRLRASLTLSMGAEVHTASAAHPASPAARPASGPVATGGAAALDIREQLRCLADPAPALSMAGTMTSRLHPKQLCAS